MDALKTKLSTWAENKPTIKALYLFGSYAKGTQNAHSDLDLAFEFIDSVDSALSELICNAKNWERELTQLTNIQVKDLHLVTDNVVTEKILIFTR